MNFVGKILVFLIFLASTVFMTGTFMVFATQKNWRDAVMDPQDGLRTQYNNQKAEITDLQRQITELEEKHALQMAERSQWLAASQSRADSNLKQYNDQRDRAESLEQQQREAVAELDALTKRLAANDEELAQVRGILDETRKERNSLLAQVEEIQDDLADKNRQVDKLGERNGQLAADLSRYRTIVADNGLQLDGDIKVEGVITAINDNFVELSIGADDGLERGKVLDIYRYAENVGEPKWLGKVEITKTDSDRAVARIIPQFSQGRRVEVGDRVATLAAP